MHELIKNFIDGEWVGAARTTKNINPATGESLGEVVVSGKEEAERAIAAAKRALPAWRRTPAPRRGEMLARAAVEMIKRKDELARALTLEEGKTLGESLGEVQKAINNLEFQSGEGRRLNGETGAVGAAVDDVLDAARAARRRGADHAVELPGRDPDLEARAGADLRQHGGAQAGVDHAVDGEDHRRDLRGGGAAARACSTSSSVPARRWGRRWSSIPTSRRSRSPARTRSAPKLYADGAARLKKVQCEMGGKNPVIVLEDADLELAATATAQGAFGSTGQRCTATSRAIVVTSVAAEFTRLVVDKARALKVGDGCTPDVNVGPLRRRRAVPDRA